MLPSSSYIGIDHMECSIPKPRFHGQENEFYGVMKIWYDHHHDHPHDHHHPHHGQDLYGAEDVVVAGGHEAACLLEHRLENKKKR